MRSLFFRISVSCFVGLAISACSSSSVVNPTLGGNDSSSQVLRSGENRPTQYLYVYNTGIPGSIPGEYARYSIPDLNLQETSKADGLGSRVAFGGIRSAVFRGRRH